MPKSKYSVYILTKKSKEKLKVLQSYKEMIDEEGWIYFYEWLKEEIEVLEQEIE